MANVVSRRLGRRIAPHEILFDAPPLQREIEFNIDVYFPKEDCYRPLGEVSPVVHTLAKEQFDDYVKRVRVFADPSIIHDVRGLADVSGLIRDAIGTMG